MFAALAHGQLTSRPARVPDFSVAHDSRVTLPAAIGQPKPLSTTWRTVPVEIVKLSPSQSRIARNNTCYAIRGYDYSADPDGSGRVTPQGSSTCQPAAKSHLKAAAGQ